MKEIVITQNDLRIFGGFFQFVKQQNIFNFESYCLVLSGEFNPWILRIFIEDANAISASYESQFACFTFPPSVQKIDVPAVCFAKKIIVVDGIKEIAGFSLNSTAIAEIVLPESIEKISQSAINSKTRISGNQQKAQEIFQNRFISPFEKNPSIQEYLLTPKKIFSAEKYWESWCETKLEKLRKKNPQPITTAQLQNMDDFCAWLSESDLFAGRIMSIEDSWDIAFIIDENEDVDDGLKYAFISFSKPWILPNGERRNGVLSFSYPPLCCKFYVDENDFAYFADLTTIFFASFENTIENFKKQEAENEEKIDYAGSLFRTQNAVLEVYKKKLVSLLPRDTVITDGENYFKLSLGYNETETYFVTSGNAEQIYKYFGGK